jgi:hypothetical protein
MTVSLTPALSQWARVTGSALRATFIATASSTQTLDAFKRDSEELAKLPA